MKSHREAILPSEIFILPLNPQQKIPQIFKISRPQSGPAIFRVLPDDLNRPLYVCRKPIPQSCQVWPIIGSKVQPFRQHLVKLLERINLRSIDFDDNRHHFQLGIW